jgi:uncharacterized protein (DUF486 family)
VPEARQKVARSETVDWLAQRNPRRQRAGAVQDASAVQPPLVRASVLDCGSPLPLFHGATRTGGSKPTNGNFFRPIRGFFCLGIDTHGFTVGYFRSSLRDFKRSAGKFSTFPFDTSAMRIHFPEMNLTESRWLPIVLLTFSNVFMTFAWYGHLKFKNKPLFIVILVSWGIAFFEYVLQVPANRWGNSVYTATQLKIIQEVITLSVFVAFAMLYLGERIRWNHIAAFVCILAAVAFTFLPKE